MVCHRAFFYAIAGRGFRLATHGGRQGAKNLLTGGDGFYIKGKNKP